MKKRQAEKFWIPFWVDKWIFGSLRIELTLEERAIWIDLLALAAKDDGYIRANENTAYPLDQLSGMLIIPIDTLNAAIKKFISLKKLKIYKNKILKIATWEKYQFSERHKRRFTSGEKEDIESEKKDSMSEKKDPILNKRKVNNKIKEKKNIKKKKSTKEIEDAFEKLRNAFPAHRRGKRDYCFNKFKALVKQGKLEEFRQTTIGYFEFLKHQKLNKNFEQEAVGLSTWMNNWEGDKKMYIGFEYKPKL